MNTKEVAALTGVSVRTLHHYDDIGLLRPARNKGNGYRNYAEQDIDRLQQILFFRACGFPLDKIKALLNSPSFDVEQAYALQYKALMHQKKQIDTMLTTLERSMQALKGEITMTDKQKFEGLDFSQNPYEEEARRLWGDDAMERSSTYVQGLGKEGQQKLADSFDALFRELGALVGKAADSPEVQTAMAEMYRYFNTSFGYTYTPEAFAGLGRMYVDDPRFTKNIDKYGEGLSALLAEAMGLYATELEK